MAFLLSGNLVLRQRHLLWTLRQAHQRLSTATTKYQLYTPREDELIIARRQEGWTVRQIADELSRPLSSIRYRLYKHIWKDETIRAQLAVPARFSENEDTVILRLRAQGMEFRAIAENLRQPPRAVLDRWRTLKTANSAARYGRKIAPPLTEDERERIVRLSRDEGLSVQQVAIRTQRSAALVSRIRREARGTAHAAKRRPYSPEEDAMLLKLREEEKLTYDAIAERMSSARSPHSLRKRYDNYARHRLPRSAWSRRWLAGYEWASSGNDDSESEKEKTG